MKKIKNNGFTIVELLAVMVILGLIAVISAPIVNNVLKGSRKSIKRKNIDTVLNASYDYVQKHPELLPSDEDTSFCVYDVVNSGILKPDIYKNLLDSKTSKIQVSYRTSKEGNYTYSKYKGNYLFVYLEDGSCVEE